MLEKFLINKFVKQDEDKAKSRNNYGNMSSFVGIFCNTILFITKLTLGLISGSISLVADSINNLSDVGTNIVTLVGFKMSVKPADKEHPFGHGRTEYISAFAVSFVILLLGYELFKGSFERILAPSPVEVTLLSGGIILITIGVKIWLSRFYMNMSKIINSQALAAASIDSRNDVLATSSVLVSFVITYFTKFVIDGYIGLLVAVFIIYNGIQFIRESMDTLIGNQPDDSLLNDISAYINNFDGIISLHDLVVHDYGPMSKMVSAHVEISANYSLIVAHEIVDRIERDIYTDMGISLVIHIDPIEETCEETTDIKESIQLYLTDYEDIVSIQDFRIMKTYNVVIFDILMKEDCSGEIKEIREKIVRFLEEKYHYEFFINIRKEKHYF
ncbi:MAG: cation transporter [Eubacteriaceae bacterium]|nr:cation transporter [Eubacteriaceae bacterium]